MERKVTNKLIYSFFNGLNNTNSWENEILKYNNFHYKHFLNDFFEKGYPFASNLVTDSYAIQKYSMKIRVLEKYKNKKLNDKDIHNLLILMNHFNIYFKEKYFESILTFEERIFSLELSLNSFLEISDLNLIENKNLKYEFTSKLGTISNNKKRYSMFEDYSIGRGLRNIEWYIKNKDGLIKISNKHNGLDVKPTIIKLLSLAEENKDNFKKAQIFRNIIMHHNYIFILLDPLQFMDYQLDQKIFDDIKNKRDGFISSIKKSEDDYEKFKHINLEKVKRDFIEFHNDTFFKKSHVLKNVVIDLIDEFIYLILEFNWEDWEERTQLLINLLKIT